MEPFLINSNPSSVSDSLAPVQHARAPSVLILGTDAFRTAEPSTSVQLIHACHALGFTTVVPASWGDELVAAESARQLAETDRPLIQCSCPLVAQHLLAGGDELLLAMLPIIPPPIATARYVRALFAPNPVSIIYVGRCGVTNRESARVDDPDIDTHLTPDDLFNALRERGIAVDRQPQVFDSALSPDRRRFYSRPGGAPSPEWTIHVRGQNAVVVEPAREALAEEIAQALLTGVATLMNPGPALGCHCAGDVIPHAGAGAKPHLAQRAPGPVLDPAIGVDLTYPLQRWVGRGHPIPPPVDPVRESTLKTDSPPKALSRQTPTSVRQVSGGTPVSRDTEGRQLPRTYVARRRSSPRGIKRSDIATLIEPEIGERPDPAPTP
jgi:hypothetical protein